MSNASTALRSEVLTFTVDAALLRELGERLIGQPHIALAELVKNSYDADGQKVKIELQDDRIIVRDNGHGMTFNEFQKFWMRVGSPHKERQEVSRHCERPLTGQKGVGRLSVQFLARELKLHTVSEYDTSKELVAHINWDEAKRAGELTQAQVTCEEVSPPQVFSGKEDYGTHIILTDLNQDWEVDDVVSLAKEIWWLEPPFSRQRAGTLTSDCGFEVDFSSSNRKAVEEFEDQMEAILDLWYAKIKGRLTSEIRSDGARKAQVFIDYGDEKYEEEFFIEDPALNEAEYEIRIFNPHGKQKRGIRVGKMREYLRENGGVHVYDDGFHLPYYYDEDWLDIERDHARRLENSELLPEELNRGEYALNYLPKNQNIFGVVSVNTARETRTAEKIGEARKGKHLKIQVSRDRLAQNQAYRNLYIFVRWGVDFFSVTRRWRKLKRAESQLKSLSSRAGVAYDYDNVEDVLEDFRDEIPEAVFEVLKERVEKAAETNRARSELAAERTGLLGSLATAGMSAMAYEHEAQKAYARIENAARSLEDIKSASNVEEAGRKAEHIASDLRSWVDNIRSTRQLFSHLLDEENRDLVGRFKARKLVHEVTDQLGVLARDAKIRYEDIDEGLRLPEATFAEWSAIFQNVIVNAVNATLDSPRKTVDLSSHELEEYSCIAIQDTGSGVDISASEQLFEPFVRRQEISAERRALGAGGSGIGLTIVRMLASKIGCDVFFQETLSADYNTALFIIW